MHLAFLAACNKYISELFVLMLILQLSPSKAIHLFDFFRCIILLDAPRPTAVSRFLCCFKCFAEKKGSIFEIQQKANSFVNNTHPFSESTNFMDCHKVSLK